MEVQHRNGTKIYCISNYSANNPAFLTETSEQRRNLAKKDVKYRKRVELLQDFEFPIASNCIKQSPDGRFIIATGTYPPRMRCFELAEYGMKFERYMDAEVRKSYRSPKIKIILKKENTKF